MAHKAFMLLSIHHMMGKRPDDFITAFWTFKWSWESWVVAQISNSNLCLHKYEWTVKVGGMNVGMINFKKKKMK